ncbi:hypothetical protein BaRGS_00026704 [Batillaria attramentaria]|uniref:Ferritin n=1 Tax=Batillaria attramentaria TaxID=370345 RepID=A0ABD0K5B9_9CAEN
MEVRNGILVWCSLFAATAAFSKNYVSEVRQNFHEKSNSDLVGQMAAYQTASLGYMAYASYFDRGNVHLPGFRKFFLAASERALKDSQRLIDYINRRGGRLNFQNIDINDACKMMDAAGHMELEFPGQDPLICRFLKKSDEYDHLKHKTKKKHLAGTGASQGQSEPEDWQNGLMALTDALLMERTQLKYLHQFFERPENLRDKHLLHTIEDEFLGEQTRRVKKLGDLITRLKLYPEQDYPLGEYVMDLEMSS